MNEKFFALAEEKQLRILNSAMEVFSKSEYKKASTDDIVAKAGISKGLLFYYFYNKKELYLYLYHYLEKIAKQQVVDLKFSGITDFFELLRYACRKKYDILIQMPYIMDFALRAYYSKGEEVSGDLNQGIEKLLAEMIPSYMSNINFSKFKTDVDPIGVFQKMVWMTDGYIHEKQRMQHPIDIQVLMEEFEKWMVMFRQLSYKEEFINETD